VRLFKIPASVESLAFIRTPYLLEIKKCANHSMNFKRGWDHTYIDEYRFFNIFDQELMTLDSCFDLSQSDILFCLSSSKILFYFSFLLWHRNKLQFPSKLRWNIYVCYGGVDALHLRFHLIWPLLINSERTEPAYRPVYYGHRQRK